MSELNTGTKPRKTIAAGDYLFRLGDEADCAYIVEKGRLQVLLEKEGVEIPIAEIGSQEIVGEMAILGGQPRTATVRALEETTLIVLTSESIDHIVEHDSRLVKLLFHILVRRLVDFHELLDVQQYSQTGDLCGSESGTAIEHPSEEMRIELPGGVLMDFRFIPAGQWTMGCNKTLEREYNYHSPSHPVRITRPFWLAKFPTTQAQWKALMNHNPSEFQGDELPVDSVSWYDCHEFIKELKNHAGAGFRLPTEAEWEYACRAGTEGAYYGDGDDEENEADVGRYAWNGKNADGAPHAVGQLLPNDWGLYDMLGNVWEWCQDRYGRYLSGLDIDPRGPMAGNERVIRGASWSQLSGQPHCAKRSKTMPRTQSNQIGFRVARLFLPEIV